MDIFQALKKDHETVKQLLSELVSLPDDASDRRSKLIQQIRDELVPHSRAEEKVFYNPLRSLSPKTHPVWHSYAEHMEAEALLRALQVEDKANAGWRKTADKLRDAVEHHIQEEETEVFDLARDVLTQEETQKLGTAFEKLKPEVREEGFMKTTLDLMSNLLPPRFSKLLGAEAMPKVEGKAGRPS